MKLVDIMPIETWEEVEKEVSVIIARFRAESSGLN